MDEQEKRFKDYYLKAVSKSISHFKDIDNKVVLIEQL